MSKCIDCGVETSNKRKCPSCISKWANKRLEIIKNLELKYGKTNSQNHQEIIKELHKIEGRPHD